MKMTKRGVYLYLDDRIIKEMKEKNINISAEVNKLLEKIHICEQNKEISEEDKQFQENKIKSTRAYNNWYDQQKEKEKLILEQNIIEIGKELDEMQKEYAHYLDTGEKDKAGEILKQMIEKDKKRLM